jgi:predicted permease
VKSEKSHSLRESLVKITQSPSVIAIVFGLALSLLNFAPQILTDTVEFSSKSFGFLVALLVPLNLTMPKPKTVVFITVAFIARIVIGLVIISVLNYIIHFDQQTFIAITLSMFSPVSVMGLIFCNQYGFDEKYYTQILAVTTITSLIFLPFVIAALKLLV